MNVSISLLIIFGTVFLVGEHVLARTLETGRAGGYYTHSGKGDRSAKAKTIINQAEHEAQSKITREEEAQVFRASLSRLQEAVKQGKVDKVLADKMVKVLSLRVKQGIMNRREAAGAIDYLILNNKINIK